MHVKKVVADEGDTGYRTILAWLNGGELLNGWTAVAGTWNSLRRIGDMVELRFYLRSNNATSKEAFYLPEGFRIGYSQIEFQSHGTGETMAQWSIYSNGMVRLSGWANTPPAGNTYHMAQVTYMTRDAWPTTLPGTAA